MPHKFSATWLVLALTAGVSTVPALAEDGPLAAARQGLLECSGADPQTRTCEEIAEYVARSDGTYRLTSRRIVNREPQIVTRDVWVAYGRDGMICARLDHGPLEKATFTIDGKDADAAQTIALRNAFLVSAVDMDHKESCMKLNEVGGELHSQYFLDNIAQPDPTPNSRVIWIGTDAGYQLAPPKPNGEGSTP